MKARYLGRFKHKYDDGVDLFYQYRGKEYMITDEHNGYSETINEKHESAQKRIDESLIKKEVTSEDTESALDTFFESIGL